MGQQMTPGQIQAARLEPPYEHFKRFCTKQNLDDRDEHDWNVFRAGWYALVQHNAGRQPELTLNNYQQAVTGEHTYNGRACSACGDLDGCHMVSPGVYRNPVRNIAH